MNIKMVSPWFFVSTILFASCMININQPVGTSSTTYPAGKITPPPSATVLPVTWSNLHLSGKLIYPSAVYQTQSTSVGVRLLDLATGIVTTIFQAPDEGWIDAITVSPDYTQMILAYTPPMHTDYGGIRTLYRLPLNGSGLPKLLFPPASEYDQYFQPEWSPDGKYLYFTHLNNGQNPVTFDIWRMSYPKGTSSKLADNAAWPRVSNDGTQLVYVWINPGTGVNRLVVANPNGAVASKLALKGLPISVIDAPMFLPDNQSILFSAPNVGQSSRPDAIPIQLNLSKHFADGSIPSDWWSMPVIGGKAQQVTNIRSLALYGSYSPDKKYVVFYSANGIFLMRPDGSSLIKIVDDVGQLGGTVSWIP
jgi:Tol biopolymer transport system component